MYVRKVVVVRLTEIMLYLYQHSNRSSNYNDFFKEITRIHYIKSTKRYYDHNLYCDITFYIQKTQMNKDVMFKKIFKIKEFFLKLLFEKVPLSL
jgi:hypothetical protein